MWIEWFNSTAQGTGIKLLELKVLHLDKKGRLNDLMLHLNFNALQVMESWLGPGNKAMYDSGF